MRTFPVRTVTAIALAWTTACTSQSPDTIDYAEARDDMVDIQLRRGIFGRTPIADQRVLDAMRAVPRHEFVPAEIRRDAYADSPLPIGHGQTISQPWIVARMTEALAVTPEDRVLEIGTGSGYQAAILAELVTEVYTIEIVEPLGIRAHDVLEKLGHENVHTRIGDGYAGWPEAAPFDAIIVTAAPERVPRPLLDQLKPGGRMVIPVGSRDDVQELRLITKDESGALTETILDAVRFVPFTREKGTSHDP